MQTYRLWMGNYENIIGHGVYVKVRSEYIYGEVKAYFFKSQKFEVRCKDGKTRRVENIYIKEM